jgi:PTS system mannose-specific IID component
VSSVPPGLSLRVFARSLLIQGSWNYRTMIGTGMAFALLPLLRYLHRHDPSGLDGAVERHAAHFNAHPYLAELALGSLVKLEADHEDEEVVRRFRSAVGGPLGALGDRLVWATWLPLCSLLALVSLQFGLAPWNAAVLFLVVFNLGHVGLRIWAFRTGLAEGKGMVMRLRNAALTEHARQADVVVVILAGVLSGLLLTDAAEVMVPGWPWVLGAALAGAAGLALGARVWRAAALIVVTAVAALLVPDLVT